MTSRFWAWGWATLLVCGGCAGHPTPTPDSPLKPVQLGAPAFPADDLGRPIKLKQPAQRVVAIGPGLVETLFDLKAEKQLVGRDDFADFPPQAKRVAIGGNFQGPNIEQCLALQPDLVIVQGETSNKGKFDDWQSKLGVPVAALTTTNFADLAKDFRKVGAWVGKSKEAQAMAKEFEGLTPASKNAPRALVQTGDEAGWIAGSGTLVADAISRGGFRNIADDLGIQGYKQINIESVLVKQPDVLIVPSKKTKPEVLASLRASQALAKLACVQQGHVVVVDGDFLLRPGPRLLQGVQQLRAASKG